MVNPFTPAESTQYPYFLRSMQVTFMSLSVYTLLEFKKKRRKKTEALADDDDFPSICVPKT